MIDFDVKIVDKGSKDVKLNLKPLNLESRIKSVTYYRGHKVFMLGMWASEDELDGKKRTPRELEIDLGEWLRKNYVKRSKDGKTVNKAVNKSFNEGVENYVGKKLKELEKPEKEDLLNRMIDMGVVQKDHDLDFE